MIDLEVEFFVKWFDCWVGWYYDTAKKRLYVCYLPCCGFWIEIRKSAVQPKQEVQPPIALTPYGE